MTIPADYEARVYAGVLGKIIGVYLGRPFEGWSNERIERELGEIQYYVHETLNAPLIVSDDDISGTFTFLRALTDHGISHDLTAEQIGETWLNYLIENRTVLWWGGMGLSTEHTAYLRLKNGVPAPQSGSGERNGKVVAEQIGSQIFIDGWAMVCPGDPEKAVALARKAASVSHDGEAIYGAQVIAAMEAQAFVEPDLNRLLDTAEGFIPKDSVIYGLLQDVRTWHANTPDDWRSTFRKIETKYGYDTYGGNCHIVPNHAVVLLALLHGDDRFQKSLMIANTAGWDTDCNSANVGCLMGIKNGLAGIESEPDWRGPVADRIFLPTADGGRCITDALHEAGEIANIGRSLAGQERAVPKGGARFHFSQPGSVQGFVPSGGECRAENVAHGGERVLAIRYAGVAPGQEALVSTLTFPAAPAFKKSGYAMASSPTLYSGQTIRARIFADAENPRPAETALTLWVSGKENTRERLRGPVLRLPPGTSGELVWQTPDTNGCPIVEVGIEIGGGSETGTVFLDRMDWVGAPRVTLKRPADGGDSWRHAWVNAVDHFDPWGTWAGMTYKLIQDEGVGFVFQGTQQWCDYTVQTEVYPHLADEIGLMAAVRGMRRYVALTLRPDGKARLVARQDRTEATLAEADLPWKLDHVYHFALTTRADGALVGAVRDNLGAEATLTGNVAPEQASGAIGLLVREGHGQFGEVVVEPAG
ncbi:MAG: ADP-ribosylglycohydrolase family protein [Cytophagales bacterium]|nr:ADP-ribosylglycohydrolase family protein [Armatimonadota bacterium]